jgi:rsbT antagonist protein RsbS
MPASVSILKQRHYLISRVPAAASDEDLIGLRDRLAQEVGEHRSMGVIVDVTDLDVMDSFSARVLRELALIIRLRGAETVIVGIQPEVAFSMVQLGLRLDGVQTALDLEEGIAYLDNRRTQHDPNAK